MSELADNGWMIAFQFLQIDEFMTVRELSKHFHDLTNPLKQKIINKHWQIQSKQLCINIEKHNYIADNWLLFYQELYYFIHIKSSNRHKDEFGHCNIKDVTIFFNFLKKRKKYFCRRVSKLLEIACENDYLYMFQLVMSTFKSSAARACNLTPNDKGPTLLGIACEHNSIKIIKYLLYKYNNTIDIYTPMVSEGGCYGLTPLSIACFHKNIEIVKLLLKFSLNKHKNDMNKYKQLKYNFNSVGGAIGWAVSRGINNIEIIKLLLNHNHIDIRCHTMEKIVMPYVDIGIAKLFIQKYKNEKLDLLQSTLKMAMEAGRMDIAQEIIKEAN